MTTDEVEREVTAALVAVDFTEDQLRLLLATPDQELIASEHHALPRLDDEEAWAWEVGGRISTLFSRDGEPLFALGIGIACPGAVHPIRGVLTESRAHEGWDELHVVDALRRHIDAPAVAMDRVQAALRGEMSFGAALDATDALYLSTREGVPVAAALVAGTVVRGAHMRPGMLVASEASDAAGIARELAEIASMVDTGLVIVDAPEGDLELLVQATRDALGAVGALAEVAASELGERAVLLGALGAAAIVAYEGEREE
jgi:hypothetical protein